MYRCAIILLLCAYSLPALAEPVAHVVLLWLEQPGNSEQRQQLISASQRLRDIPGVERLVIGEALASERAIVDDSFDVGLYFYFPDADTMRRYLVHPVHVEVVRNHIKPLVREIRVHDFLDHSAAHSMK